MSPLGDVALALVAEIEARRAKVVVIGQGVVGVPEAIAIAAAGFSVAGLDRDAGRVAGLQAGQSPFPDVANDTLQRFLTAGTYRATSEAGVLDSADVVVICVPTPLTSERVPDLSMVDAAVRAISRASVRPRLTILASTVPPGTTRAVVLPRLLDRGGEIGANLFLAFAPERLDPGNQTFTLATTPRLVSGITESCRSLAETFYRGVVETIKLVDAPEIAELAKSFENSFRFLNISFANEVAVLCDRLGYSIWEVIDAAATKPFAFLPHFPGPGVGGSCIPIVPHYLRHVAEQAGVPARLIDRGVEINDEMPGFVVGKLARLLAERGGQLVGARILVVGVTYKANVPDIRESPAIQILRLLRGANADASYNDPYVPSLTVDGVTLTSVPLSVGHVATSEAILLLALHDVCDRQLLLDHARLIFDTRNALGAAGDPHIVTL